MVVAYKVLGQVAPSANIDAILYTVPPSTSAILSTINVCNRSTVAITYRIAIQPAGAALANQHYQAYDVSLVGGDSVALTLGITLAATDVVTVRANSENASFSVFGSEIT